MPIYLLLLFLLAGLAAGRFIRLPESLTRIAGWVVSACVYMLVFTLGLKLGSDKGILSQFGSIGVGTIALCAGCTSGSILAVVAYLAVKKLLKGRRA